MRRTAVALACALAMASAKAAEPAAEQPSYLIPALDIVGFDFLLNRFDNAYFGCCDYRVTRSTIQRNLHSSWVEDRDPFKVNQLGHPYQGSMYHTFARSAGLGYWEASLYTFMGSAFWEIAGESTLPSRNDQITTGIGGSFLGEALFRMASLVLEKEGLHSDWREIGAAVVSPATAFNRKAFGDRFKHVFDSHNPAHFTRLQLGFSGEANSDPGSSTSPHLKRNEALADFYLDYGLPGKRGYQYERPFDYFNFQATLSSANGFENVLTRGLLKGRAYEDDRYRGFFGLYGSYDYIFPQSYRVAATALSLGTTAQVRLSDSWTLQGTGTAGLGYTSVGTSRSSVDGDYHYGVAPQALGALRLIFRDRAALDVTAREYYVTRVFAAQRGGHDNIARVDAALTWRIIGRHALSVKFLGNYRNASFGELGNTSPHRTTVGLFYTLLGHERFGVVDW